MALLDKSKMRVVGCGGIKAWRPVKTSHPLPTPSKVSVIDTRQYMASWKATNLYADKVRGSASPS